MKKRSVAAVLLLPLITFGIYQIYWMVDTKSEMNAMGQKIPTAWLLIVPVVYIWWYWKYCEGVDSVTDGKTSGVLAFILLWLLGSIGCAIIQDSFNKLGETPVATTPGSPVASVPMPETPAVAAETSAPSGPTNPPVAG